MISGAAWQRFVPELNRLSAAMPKRVNIQGMCTKAGWLPRGDAAPFDTTRFSGIIEHDVQDQVVVVWAGTLIEDLQDALLHRGQQLALPRSGHPLIDGVPGTVGGLIAMNMPHGFAAQAGQIKDWVLGLAIMRKDGTWARCGSKAVKSVAGYDIQRLFSGARGTLGLIGAATLRVSPIGAAPRLQAKALHDWRGEPCWIQRVLRTDFDRVVAESDLFAADPASSTLWHRREPMRVEDDWVMGPGGVIDPPQAPPELVSRAKEVFDPDNRFNPHIKL